MSLQLYKAPKSSVPTGARTGESYDAFISRAFYLTKITRRIERLAYLVFMFWSFS